MTPTVAALLAQSHTAHQRYRDALPRGGAPGDTGAQQTALAAAYQARSAAIAADPEQNDPAWQDEAGAYDHVALLEFYRAQLGRVH